MAEVTQALDSLNLGERSAATLGDVMLRANGLLSDPTSDAYAPIKPLSAAEVCCAMIAALDAAGLGIRVRRPAFGSNVASSHQARLTKAGALSLYGLSGGEQQRLRLASLFLLERLRFDVWHRGEAIPHLEPQPARVLLLDEPDHQIDIAFPFVFASLMRTLHPEHLPLLATVVVMHSPLDLAGIAEAAQPPRYVPRLGLIELSEKLLDDATLPMGPRTAVCDAWDILQAEKDATAATVEESTASAASSAPASRTVFVAEYRPL